MFSNLRLIVWILLGIFAISNIGCDRFLKSSATAEEKAKQETIVLSPSGLGCLAVLPAQLDQFIQDKAQASEIDAAFSCMSKSLDTFSKFTAGASADVYTDDELRHFLNRYLLKTNQVTVGFMRELMKLKLLIIGGSARSMTRTELKQMEYFLSILKQEALKLNGWMRILLFQASAPDVSGEKLEELSKLLKTSAKRLVSETKAAGSVFEFSDIQTFIVELQTFLGPSKALGPILKWMPLLSSLKTVFFGSQTRMQSEREWQEATAYALDGYAMALDFFYRLRKQDMDSPAVWTRVLRFVDAGLDFIDRAPVLVREGRLETNAVDAVLDEVWKLDLLKMELNVETLKKTYRMVILRVLDRNESRQAQAPEVVAIDRKHLSVLRHEYNVWRLAQNSILSLFMDRNVPEGADITMLAQALSDEPVLTTISKMKQGPQLREALLTSWNQWGEIVTGPRPLQWTNSGKILLRYDVPSARTSFVGLNILNGLRSLSRLVLRAYGEGTNPDPWKLMIKQASLTNMERDFREMGRAIKFLDPRSADPAGRTFKEANFFTFHGNGDQWLDSLELTEELSLLVSGGAKMATEVMKMAGNAQCENGKIDILGWPVYQADCFEQVFKKNFSVVMEGLPGMTTLAKLMPERDWRVFYDSMLTVSALDQRDPKAIEFAEIRNSVVVLQYVETLMVVYDTNRDGRMHQDEVLAAAPRFRSFIESLSPLGNFMVDDIFLYLAFKGKKPGAGDLVAFKFEKQFGLGDIGRVELMKVLAVLKKDAGK
jgi:hypothetical protein